MIWDSLKLLNTVAATDAMPQVVTVDDAGYALSRSLARITLHRLSVTYLVDHAARCALLEFRDQHRSSWFDYKMRDLKGTYPARFMSDIAFQDFAPGWFTATFDLEVFAPDVPCIYGEAGQVEVRTVSYRTFYYAKSVPAPISPAFHSSWDETMYAARFKLLRHPLTDGEGLAEATFGDVRWPGSSQDWLLLQFVSDPMADQTISGTVRGQIQGIDTVEFTGSADGEVFTSIMIRVVSNDGTTERGVLLPLTVGTAGLTNTFTNRRTPISAAVSSLAVEEGDRLVVEVGISRSSATAEPLASTNQFLKVRHGSKVGGLTNLLPVDDTDTSTNKVPWLQFGNAIQFIV